MSSQPWTSITPLGRLLDMQIEPRADGRVHGALLGSLVESALPLTMPRCCPVPPAANAPFFLDAQYDCRGRLAANPEAVALRVRCG